MAQYNLRYASRELGQPVELAFEERSLAGALDVARARAQGIWAELWHDGRPLCQLELVSGCGVWLVGGPDAARSQHRANGNTEELRISVPAA